MLKGMFVLCLCDEGKTLLGSCNSLFMKPWQPDVYHRISLGILRLTQDILVIPIFT
jgi:hypothetical protein